METPEEKKEEGKKYPAAWTARIEPFAKGIGKTTEEVTNVLAKITGEPTDDATAAEALEVLDNKEASPDADLKEVFKEFNIPTGKLNLHLSKLRGEPAVKAEATTTTTAAAAFSSLAILPEVPSEESFLEALKTGGVVKVEKTEVVSAVKAIFAKSVGLYELPEKILKKMEAFAEAQDDPCGEDYYKVMKLVTEKKYGDVLSVMGLTGAYVTEARKKLFFQKLDDKLPRALNMFNVQLNQWYESWTKTFANPGLMVAAMAGASTGTAIPAGIMAPPETDSLRTAAEEVINEINRIFAGSGIPVARALAYDATRIMGVLSDPKLPVQLGVPNKETMLKELGIKVGSDLVRNEQAIIRYTLAVMSLPKVPADTELEYLSAMIKLSSSITWTSLGGTKLSGIGTGV